ncbi:MAG: hypothetical protein U1E48_15190 [Paracoccaceae bacterium]
MTETLFLATFFALLAFAGIEPQEAPPMKVCQVGLMSDVLGGC